MKEITSNTPSAEVIVRPTDFGGVSTILVRESLIRSLLDKGIAPVITVERDRLPPATMLPKKVLVIAPVITLNGEPTMLLRDTYLEALSRNNLIPIIIPGNYPLSLARELLDQTDGLVLTGGSDINPSKYGDSPLKTTEKPDDHRDLLELMLSKAFYEARKPVVGICRGIQVMNVSMGGKIIQQVDDHALEIPSYASLTTQQAHHPVHILPGTKFQSIFPVKPLKTKPFPLLSLTLCLLVEHLDA